MGLPTTPSTSSGPVGLLQVGGTEVRLWKLPFSIGRSSKNTMTIRDRHLSRSHCEIHRTADGFEIRNLSDLNPTLVNGKEVTSFLLADGDEIRIHDHTFIFRLSAEDSAQDDDDSDVHMAVAVAAPASAPGPAATTH